MHNIVIESQLDNLTTTAARLGVKLPTDFTNVYTHAQQLSHIALPFEVSAAADQLTPLIGNPKQYDTKRAELLPVLLNTRVAHELDQALANAAIYAANNAAHQNADKILTAFKPFIDQRATELIEAARALKDAPTELEHMNVEQFSAHKQATQLEATLNEALNAIQPLLPDPPHQLSTERHLTIFALYKTTQTLSSIWRTTERPNALTYLAARGATLDTIATREEYTQRLHALLPQPKTHNTTPVNVLR